MGTPFALRAAFLPPIDLNPGRAFIEKWIDISGDLEAAVDTMSTAVGALPKSRLPQLLAQLMRLPKAPAVNEAPGAQLNGRLHSRDRDAEAVRFHYDVPVSFYRSFLGDALVYSCAYAAGAAHIPPTRRDLYARAPAGTQEARPI